MNYYTMPDAIHDIKFNQQKIYFVYGPMQSGKTKAILHILDKAKKFQTNAFVLVRNMTADQQQLEDRAIKWNEDYRTSAYLGAIHKYNSVTSGHSFRDAFTRASPNDSVSLLPGSHYLALGNHVTGGRLIADLEKIKVENGNGVLIIDEADLIGLDFDTKNTNLTKIEQFIISVRPYFHTIILISATPLASILTEGSNKITDMIVLDIPDDYYGVKQLNHVSTLPYIKQKGEKHKYDANNDSINLKKFASDILSENHAIGLIKTSRDMKDHKLTLDYLKSNYPSISYIVYNDGNALVYTGNDVVNTTTIKEALDFLRAANQIDPSLHNHVIIISGNMADRGISFTSGYDDNGNCWHLTHQYIVSSKVSNLDTIMQGLRICGRYNDSPSLKLYCIDELWKSILKMDEEFDRIIKDFHISKKLPNFVELANNLYHITSSRKRKAVGYENGKTENWVTTKDDAESSNVPILNKVIPMVDIDDNLCNEIAKIHNIAKQLKRGQGIQRHTKPFMEKLCAELSKKEKIVKFGLIGEFDLSNFKPTIKNADRWRFDSGSISNDININPKANTDWRLAIVNNDNNIPVLVIKSNNIREYTDEYAWYDLDGQLYQTGSSRRLLIKI